MKKWIAALLAVIMMMSLLAACNAKTDDDDDKKPETTAPEATEPKDTTPEATTPEDPAKPDGVMSYEEYLAAELETEVTVLCSVQATQSWWDNKITVYAADEDGAYFLYEMACTQEDAAKLTPGTLIKATGVKAEWAGEVEITEATFEFVESEAPFIAEPTDVTALLGSDEMIKYQNQAVLFHSMTVKEISFKNNGGDDIYVTLTKGGKDYSFCVEVYLTGTETAVYKTASELQPGDVIDVFGFLYWYEGMNPHIMAIQEAPAMTYAEYAAAELESPVTISCYVQATQSWWDNKITVYAADADGAYFLYELGCSEEEAEKLVPGTLITVTGVKGAWAGEVEVMDGSFEFVDKAAPYITTAIDLTDKLEAADLINYQNQLVTFTGMTVKEVSFKNEGGDDIYVTLTKDGKDYNFCVEVYLTGTETEVYKAASALTAGQVVNVTGFLYWYEGMNPHITAITVA